MHGGEVSLVEITDDNVAVVSFGGGCQGCSAVDLTLKNLVEDNVKKAVPEITAVMDVTDHSNKTNAYYK
jgi:Fe/S biogenesis protein NfuA